MALEGRKYPTEIIAHRGLSGLAPENTLAAFRAAIECGADRIELDVHLSKDGVPVVIHDADLDRTTNGAGPVVAATLEELRRLDAGAWFSPRFAGERIPTLEETLELLCGTIGVNVEIKEEAVQRMGPAGARGEAQDGVEVKVARALARPGRRDSVIVSSFEPLALERLRAIAPEIPLEVLHNDPSHPPGRSELERARELGARALNVWRDELLERPELVSDARALGLGIKVYTVDEPADLERFLRLGVAGIFTNRPDVLRSLVDPDKPRRPSAPRSPIL
jgi:glycerophosphoryl diester phosphodiesterase